GTAVLAPALELTAALALKLTAALALKLTAALALELAAALALELTPALALELAPAVETPPAHESVAPSIAIRADITAPVRTSVRIRASVAVAPAAVNHRPLHDDPPR